MTYICNRKINLGGIAQSVEQRTENPCVPGSIPGATTPQKSNYESNYFFFLSKIYTDHDPFLIKKITEKQAVIK